MTKQKRAFVRIILTNHHPFSIFLNRSLLFHKAFSFFFMKTLDFKLYLYY